MQTCHLPRPFDTPGGDVICRCQLGKRTLEGSIRAPVGLSKWILTARRARERVFAARDRVRSCGWHKVRYGATKGTTPLAKAGVGSGWPAHRPEAKVGGVVRPHAELIARPCRQAWILPGSRREESTHALRKSNRRPCLSLDLRSCRSWTSSQDETAPPSVWGGNSRVCCTER